MLGYFTAAVGKALGGTPRAKVHVRSRVPIPAVVEPPRELLRALRELDKGLDVFILPDGRVWLLQYQENRHRQAEGRKLLALARAEGDYFEEFAPLLMAHGFALLSEEDYQHGTSVGYMVARAQRVLYATESEVRQEMRKRRRFADNTTQAEIREMVIRERIRAHATSDWSWAHRGRKSFSSTM